MRGLMFKSQRVSATEYVIGAFVTQESAEDRHQSAGPFEDEADLRAFLESAR